MLTPSRQPAAGQPRGQNPGPAPRAVPIAARCRAPGFSRLGSAFRVPRSAIRLRQTPAGHILVAGVRIALAHHLLLAADQLLALRWVRSSGWDCYVPAALLNTWHLALANAERGTRSAESQTARLPDLPC